MILDENLTLNHYTITEILQTELAWLKCKTKLTKCHLICADNENWINHAHIQSSSRSLDLCILNLVQNTGSNVSTMVLNFMIFLNGIILLISQENIKCV